MLLFEATFCIIYGNRIKDLALKGDLKRTDVCKDKIQTTFL